MMSDPFVLDRLVALKNAFGDIGSEPFDIRDDRSCSYRVLSNLIVHERLARALEREGRRLNRSLLGDYAAGGAGTWLAPALRRAVEAALADAETSHATLSALVGRCLVETEWSTADLAGLNRRAAQVHVDLLREMERHYRALVAEGPPTLATAAPIVDFEALAGHLGNGAPTKLHMLHVINGGYSKVTIVCELERGGHASRKIVVRSDAGLAFAGTSVLDEYPVLKTMHEAGVAVPKPIWAGRTSVEALPVLVVEFSEGRPFGSPATAAYRNEALCRSMGLHLARIHSVDPALLGCVGEDSADFNRRAVTAELDEKSTQMRAMNQPMPLLEYTLGWLRSNITSVGGRITVVHGDYGPHNLLAIGDDVHGVLDWEFVKLGNPAEDLCFGRLAIEELGDWDDFLNAYEMEGGVRPSDDELYFYTIFSLYRLCVMMMRTDAVFGASDTKAIRMVTPGAERLRPALLKLARQLGLEIEEATVVQLAAVDDHAG